MEYDKQTTYCKLTVTLYMEIFFMIFHHTYIYNKTFKFSSRYIIFHQKSYTYYETIIKKNILYFIKTAT